MTISPIWGRIPSKRTNTKFGMRGRVADIIICFKFYWNWLRGFWAVRGQKWGSSIDFDRRPYNWSALPCCLWCLSASMYTRINLRHCWCAILVPDDTNTPLPSIAVPVAVGLSVGAVVVVVVIVVVIYCCRRTPKRKHARAFSFLNSCVTFDDKK